MKHLIFFVHILSFILGCITISMSYITYLRYRSKSLKYYIYFLISFTAVLLERTVTYYRLASVINSEYMDVILWVISCLGCGLLMYSLPLFIHELLELKISEGRKMIFGLLGYLPVISLVLYYTLPYKLTILTVISSIIFLIMLYCLVLTAVNLKNIANLEKKKIIKTFLIILGVSIPYLLVDARIEQLGSFQKLFPFGLLSIPVFYLVWNSFSLYFGIKYYGNSYDSGDKDEKEGFNESVEEESLTDNFFDQYKITNREKEVILLLAKGYSYNRISEELVITLTTTRTHIYNVYKKTGAKNKVELINLMKNNQDI